MRSPFVLPESVRGYSQYAEFNVGTETVLAALGYGFSLERLVLPTVPVTYLPADSVAFVRRSIETAFQIVAYQSEMARREFFVAPVLLEAARIAGARIAPEHAFDLSPQLRGSFDYLLQRNVAVIVIEAKNADMVRGFTQLAAQMVAFDKFAEADVPVVYGAVTIGESWRFGLLNRETKAVTQDLNDFTLPSDLERLLTTLVGILQDAPAPEA